MIQEIMKKIKWELIPRSQLYLEKGIKMSIRKTVFIKNMTFNCTKNPRIVNYLFSSFHFSKNLNQHSSNIIVQKRNNSSKSFVQIQLKLVVDERKITKLYELVLIYGEVQPFDSDAQRTRLQWNKTVRTVEAEWVRMYGCMCLFLLVTLFKERFVARHFSKQVLCVSDLNVVSLLFLCDSNFKSLFRILFGLFGDISTIASGYRRRL